LSLGDAKGIFLMALAGKRSERTSPSIAEASLLVWVPADASFLGNVTSNG
jgi:hypothetical protein